MWVSSRNYKKIENLFYFCALYNIYRDFDLHRRVAKSKPLNWEQAENLSNFTNQLIKTKESCPQDFIHVEEDSVNTSIDKYIVLKNTLNDIKNQFGAKYKNDLFKSVKKFYKKRLYCYEMDSYFTFVIYGMYLYVNKIISFKEFLDDYPFETSLFTGKKTPIKLKRTIKIANYILNI